MHRTTPCRMPQACGVLGSYDRDRVARMAALLGLELGAVHEDRDSILMLDREPLRWGLA